MEKTENLKEVEELFQVGAHYAFRKSRRHPSVKSYILGVKDKTEIFDLKKTSANLERAIDFIKETAAKGGQILFVSSKVEAREAIKQGASSIGMPYVAGRWIGGTLTNFPEIKKRVEKLEDLEQQKEKGELAKYTKKERLLIDREIEKLKEMFSGLLVMKGIPKAIFIIDSRREQIALKEAKMKEIPVVSLSNSDCNLKEIDYPIPANDNSVSSIKYFVNQIVEAVKEGQEQYDTNTRIETNDTDSNNK